jgi:hypothetical protein
LLDVHGFDIENREKEGVAQRCNAERADIARKEKRIYFPPLHHPMNYWRGHVGIAIR